MKNFLFFIAAIFLFASCEVKIDSSEAKGLLFGYDRGLMVGVEIGDSWEDVKAKHRDGWEVHETDGFFQYRKNWDKGSNMMNVTFSLDENQKVKSMDFNLFVSKKNFSELTELHKLFVQDFNLILADNITNDWTYYAPNGGVYAVKITVTEFDEMRQNLTVEVIEKL